MTTQPWSERETSAVIQAVAETADPTLAACAVIGAMIGVIAHYENDEFARKVLNVMAVSPLITEPVAANTNRDRLS